MIVIVLGGVGIIVFATIVFCKWLYHKVNVAYMRNHK